MSKKQLKKAADDLATDCIVPAVCYLIAFTMLCWFDPRVGIAWLAWRMAQVYRVEISRQAKP